MTKRTIRLVRPAKTQIRLRILIRVSVDRICLLQPPGYPKRATREPLPYSNGVQADRSLCWSRRSYCRFCRALAQMYFSTLFCIDMVNTSIEQNIEI